MTVRIPHIVTPGQESVQRLDTHRRGWKPGEELAFLIGSPADLAELEGACDAPPDLGAAAIDASKTFDVPAWIESTAPVGGKSWPKQPVAPQRTLTTLFDLSTRLRKPEICIGLVRVNAPEDLFAGLGYGGWNACPDAHVHVAVHRHWWQTCLASPVAISAAVVECHVNRPPTTRAAALALAREHFSYCPDIVEQGTGSISKLASSLLDSKLWYFWWD